MAQSPNIQRLEIGLHYNIFSISVWSGNWDDPTEGEAQIDVLETWCWRWMLRIPWTAKWTNQSILHKTEEEGPLSAEIYAKIQKYLGSKACGKRAGDTSQ